MINCDINGVHFDSFRISLYFGIEWNPKLLTGTVNRHGLIG